MYLPMVKNPLKNFEPRLRSRSTRARIRGKLCVSSPNVLLIFRFWTDYIQTGLTRILSLPVSHVLKFCNLTIIGAFLILESYPPHWQVNLCTWFTKWKALVRVRYFAVIYGFATSVFSCLCWSSVHIRYTLIHSENLTTSHVTKPPQVQSIGTLQDGRFELYRR